MKTLLALLIAFNVRYSTANIICDLVGNGATAEVNITSECMEQMKIVCNNDTVLWRMIDASSKWPNSGMSYSSNKDLGNYDECIDIDYDGLDGQVKGKYCGWSVAVVNLFLQGIPNPFSLELDPKPLAAAKVQYTHKDLRELRDDTGTVSVSVLSMCVPDKCTPREVGLFFLWGYISELQIVNFVDALPCMTKESNTNFRGGDIAFTTILAIIGILVILSTGYDAVIQKLGKKPQHPLYLAFSVLTNGQKLLHVTEGYNYEQIRCLNGIRFISMLWVICGHGFIALETIPLINNAEATAYEDQVQVMYAAASPIAVDTFFFLSGFLLTFGYIKASTKLPPKVQAMRLPAMIIHRYLRLTPAVAMLFFTAVTIFRMTGTGPLWDAVSSQMSQQCTDHWWAFFLYIQNYVNYNDMCLNHTWYLSADMQMFILAPIVLIPITMLIKRDQYNYVYIGLGVLIPVFVIIPMATRFADFSIDNVYDTHSRLNTYLIGVLLGVIMRDPRSSKFPFSKLTNLTIWCFVLNADVAFNLYYHNVVRIYDHTSDTLFYGLYRPVWSLSLAWMVYSCHHGYGGVVNWILSLPAFQVGARLSYCMYLVHAVVEMYYVGVIRTQYYWGDYMEFYLWCGHFIVTMIISTVWSLSFESPMIVIEKFLFGGGARKPKEQVAKAH